MRVEPKTIGTDTVMQPLHYETQTVWMQWCQVILQKKQENLKNTLKTGNLTKNKPNMRWHENSTKRKTSKKIK